MCLDLVKQIWNITSSKALLDTKNRVREKEKEKQKGGANETEIDNFFYKIRE